MLSAFFFLNFIFLLTLIYSKNLSNIKILFSTEEKNSLEAKILKSVAYLIFDALDYGNSCQNEPDLKNSLQNLLVQMSGHFKEYTSNRLSEDDEGYDQEEDEVTCFDKALEICTSNVSEADYHYKAVCRGLYAQAYELKVFLAKIEQSKVTKIFFKHT